MLHNHILVRTQKGRAAQFNRSVKDASIFSQGAPALFDHKEEKGEQKKNKHMGRGASHIMGSIPIL